MPEDVSSPHSPTWKSRLERFWNAGRSPKGYLIGGIATAVIGGLLWVLEVTGWFIFVVVAVVQLIIAGRYWWAARTDLSSQPE